MKRAVSTTILLGLLWLCAGCGLDDYERKMMRAQARAQSFDEASGLLSDPIEPPTIIDIVNDKPTEVGAPLFLRPPRSLASNPQGTLEGKLVRRYRRLKDVAKGGSEQDQEALAALKEMYVAAAVDRADLKIFARDVLRAWKQDANGLRPQSGRAPAGATQVEGVEFDDTTSSYTGYFVKGVGPTMVGVVFQCDRGKRDAARKVMDLAVEWMALDGKAGEAQRWFDKSKGAKNPAAANAAPAPPAKADPSAKVPDKK